ncbi:hypothetical protein KCP73_01885 [Salmonella enterica subsp. enterica]|nr:hypothetical protein KCP73_01885 [Salmonella enterica subsp. enterica]
MSRFALAARQSRRSLKSSPLATVRVMGYRLQAKRRGSSPSMTLRLDNFFCRHPAPPVPALNTPITRWSKVKN